MEKKRRIRIVHIVQSPGGVERYLRALFKYMDHEKFENILIGSYDYAEENYRGIVDHFSNVDMIRSIQLSKDLKAIVKVRSLLKLYSPDIVYCHSSKAGAIGRIANIGLHNFCIYNPHGWAFNMGENQMKRWIYAGIEKCLTVSCGTIVCISEAEKNSALKKHVCSERKLHVINSGIDFAEYQTGECGITRKQIGIPEDSFVIGMVGRLSEQKAPDVFVKAAKVIKEKIPQAFFVMVGDGPEQNEVEQLINTYGMKDSFCITGWVSNPMAYIKLFDIAALLSRWEGFGLVLPEYMLAGKPIVATQVDAIPYIIADGQNGILVRQDDYRAAAEKMIELYEKPELANALRTRASAIVRERYDVRRVVREHGELFEGVVLKQREIETGITDKFIKKSIFARLRKKSTGL